MICWLELLIRWLFIIYNYKITFHGFIHHFRASNFFSRVLRMCMLVVRRYGIIFWSYDISVLNCVLLVLYGHQVSNTCYKKLFRIPCCLNKKFQGLLYKLKIRFDIQIKYPEPATDCRNLEPFLTRPWIFSRT